MGLSGPPPTHNEHFFTQQGMAAPRKHPAESDGHVGRRTAEQQSETKRGQPTTGRVVRAECCVSAASR